MNRKSNRFVAAVLSAVMLLSLAGCGGSTSSSPAAASGSSSAALGVVAAQSPVTLKLSSTIAVGAPGDLAAQDFKAAVEERTGGAVSIDYYPAGQLGSSDEISEQLLEGTIDLSWQTLEWYMTLQKDWNVLGLGFSVGDKEQLKRFLESDKQAEIEQKLIDEDGIRMLACDGISSPRVLVTTFPVQTAAEMVGVNMRVPSSTLYTKTWQAIGVNCITLGSGDVYMGFKDGMINATEFPLGSIYSNAYHEVAKNITYTNHLFSIYCMGMNENSWQNKLTPETQEIIKQCAEEACENYMEYDSAAVANGIEAMKAAGVQFNEAPDLASFRAKMADVASACEADGLWSAGLYEYVQSLA